MFEELVGHKELMPCQEGVADGKASWRLETASPLPFLEGPPWGDSVNALKMPLCSRRPLYTLSLLCVSVLISGLGQSGGGILERALEAIVGLATGLPGN